MNPTEPTTALTKKPETVKEWLQAPDFKDAVAKALPNHLTPDRQIRIALTALNRTPKLMRCTPASVLQCVLDLSAAGLEPDGRRAHLIPFEDRKTGTVICTLIFDYKGLVELAMRSGQVANIHADVICDADKFEADRGIISKHKVNYREPRGLPYAAYCIIRFKNKTEKSEVMTRDEIESIRRRSRAGQDGPWVTDWNEMAKKTVARRALKWVPLSPEIREKVEADDDPQDVTDIVANAKQASAFVAAASGKPLAEPPPEVVVPAEEQIPGVEEVQESPSQTPQVPPVDPPTPETQEKRRGRPPKPKVEEPPAAAPATNPEPNRDAIIETLKGLLLDYEVTPEKLFTYARKIKVAPEKIADLFALPTETLAHLIPAISAISTKAKT